MVPIHLDKLSKRFDTPRGTVLAVDDVTLTVAAGELFFLLGPSGCGKTTLLRMLAGFVEPTAGTIFFGARDVTHAPPEKRDAALVFQNYALWPHMTVEKNVGFGPQVRGVRRAERRQTVAEMLQTVRIAEKAAAKPMELSGGQQQRVALARALAAKPRCLLLDEPLSNLDASLRAAMRWEIRRIVKSAGTTGVYVTHDQAEALAIADRIALMRDGRIVQVGTGAHLYESPANRFVAEFLGQANFLAGAVVGRQDGYVLVETPAGRLRGRAGGDETFAPGQKVLSCIRPEVLRAERPGPNTPQENALGGTMLEWVHLGESARYRVRLAGGLELSGAVMPARPAAGVGEPVVVCARAEDVIVLTE